jgi:hypothetical protein
MGANGHAYVAWSAGGDVRAARLDEHTGWAGVPVALDIDPAADAGSGSDRPRVAAGADGHAIVTWGENGRVWERRLLGTRLSAHPQDAGPGTAPQIDVEDDSSFASVVLSGPGGTLWRRLKGSAFEAPVGVGGPSQAADVAVDGRGMGYAVAAAPSGEITGLAFDDDVAAALVAVGSGSDPVTAVGELGEVAVAWRTASDVRARIADQPEPLQPEAVLSRAELPPPGPPAIASDLRGDVAVAMLQGDQLVIAEHDQPPGKPAGGTTEHWRARARPELRWRAGSEQWGPVSFSILLDGTPIATTAATTIRVPARIPDGSHSWIVRAVDRRGQVVDSDARRLRVDVTAPVPKLKIRRSGSLARITVIATDAASGIKRTKLTFPDGSSTGARSLQRRFGSGTHSLKLGVVDRAGNVARKIFRLRVP